MGWAYGEVKGRPVGYAVVARCDEAGCKEIIDRGVSYACGGDAYGGVYGCGKFFCENHVVLVGFRGERSSELCAECLLDLQMDELYRYDDEEDEWYFEDGT